MKKYLLLLVAIVCFTVNSEAKVKFGLRGGANITKMSFDKEVIDSKNTNGFYLGPTVKIGLPLGFDIDGSIVYSQWKAETEVYNDENKIIELKHKAVDIPLNLRKGFGLGDKASVFLFAGPQFSFNIGNKDLQDINWTWKDSEVSINLGVGAMLLNHIEIKANYNIPCGKTGSFNSFNTENAVTKNISGKKKGWQIGAAIYF